MKILRNLLVALCLTVVPGVALAQQILQQDCTQSTSPPRGHAVWSSILLSGGGQCSNLGTALSGGVTFDQVGQVAIQTFSNVANAQNLYFSHSRGSLGVLAPIQTNDILMSLAAAGVGTDNAYHFATQIIGRATGTISSVVPGQIEFYTANASGVMTEAAFIDSVQTLQALHAFTAGNGAWVINGSGQATAGSINWAGNIITSTSVQANQAWVLGANSAFEAYDRTPADASHWSGFYRLSDVTYFYDSVLNGNTLAYDTSGNIFVAGGGHKIADANGNVFGNSLTSVGDYLYFNNTTFVVNSTGGPGIYADASNMVSHLGAGNGAFYWQNTSGSNIAQLNSVGAFQATGQVSSTFVGAGVYAQATNTGGQEEIYVNNSGLASNPSTIAYLDASLNCTSCYFNLIAAGGSSPQAQVQAGAGLTGGMLFSVGAGSYQFTGGNVGIETTSPNAWLTVGTPLGGTSHSTILSTNGGALGGTVGNDISVASIGFTAGNQVMLGVHAHRFATGTDWTGTSIGLTMDVDNAPGSGGGIWLGAGGGVGIGTYNAQAQLDLGDLVQDNRLYVFNDGSNRYGFGIRGSQMLEYAASGAITTFGTMSSGGIYTEFVRIDGSGRVGIGTTNPLYSLDVNGIIHSSAAGNLLGSASGSAASPTSSNTNILLYYLSSTNWSGIGADATGSMYLTTGNGVAPSTRLYISTGGLVGIGTTNPCGGCRMDAQTTGAGTYAYHFANHLGSGLGGLYEDSSNNGLLALYTGAGVENVVLSASGNTFFNGGNVGIGTNSPAQALTVYRSGASDVFARFINDSQASGFDVGLSAGGGSFVFNRNNSALTLGTNNTGRAVIDQNGNFILSSVATGIQTTILVAPILDLVNASFVQQQFQNAATAQNTIFTTSRSATIGGQTILQAGDYVMQLVGYGSNGTSYQAVTDVIGRVDTVSGSNLFGRFEWYTANSSGSLTQRMSLDSGGGFSILAYPNCTGFTSNAGGTLQCTTSMRAMKDPAPYNADDLISKMRAAFGTDVPVWSYKDPKRFGPRPGNYVGLYADDVCKLSPDLCVKRPDGTFDYYERGVLALAVIRGNRQQDELDRDRAELAELTKRVSVLQRRLAEIERPNQ